MMQRYREEKIDRVRELSMQVLQRVHVEDAYANVALAGILREVQLLERDRRFLTELVYGVTKAGASLDYMIGCYVTDIRKAQPAIRELLRLGFYQIFCMDRVPPSAACNTAVELAKNMDAGGRIRSSTAFSALHSESRSVRHSPMDETHVPLRCAHGIRSGWWNDGFVPMDMSGRRNSVAATIRVRRSPYA